MVISIHYGGEKDMFKNKLKQTQSQQVYIPAYVDVLPEATRRSPIVAQETADQICGVALRVGWIGKGGNRRAIYRLKLRMNHARYGTATLPGFFVIEDNVFVEYVQHVQKEVTKMQDSE